MLEDQVEESEDSEDHFETLKQQKSKAKTHFTRARQKLLALTIIIITINDYQQKGI